MHTNHFRHPKKYNVMYINVRQLFLLCLLRRCPIRAKSLKDFPGDATVGEHREPSERTFKIWKIGDSISLMTDTMVEPEVTWYNPEPDYVKYSYKGKFFISNKKLSFREKVVLSNFN
jgi:hypothetical protein